MKSVSEGKEGAINLDRRLGEDESKLFPSRDQIERFVRQEERRKGKSILHPKVTRSEEDDRKVEAK